MTNRIDEIRERLEKATPGPWKHAGSSLTIYADSQIVAQIAWQAPLMNRETISPVNGQSNAIFIAHAPADITYLLAELSSRDARIKELEKHADNMYFAVKNQTNARISMRLKVATLDYEKMKESNNDSQ